MIFSVIISAMILAVSISATDPYTPHKLPPIPYHYNYGVKDDYSGTNFDQNEKSDGNLVQGSYTVQLPDGRRQIVEYEADHVRGYVAKVSYEGKASYPSHGAPAIVFPPSGGYH